VTDDSAAIQAAVDSLGSGGGTVLFPSGKSYAVSAPIMLPAGNTRRMDLFGYGASIRLTATTPRFLIWNTKASYLSFRHFTVEGFTVDAQGHHPSSGSWSVVGFDCTWGYTSYSNIEDVTVKDVNTVNVPTMNNPQAWEAYNVNVYTSQSNANEATWNHISDVLVQNCTLKGGTAGVSIWGGGGSNRSISIDRVYIRDCWHDTQFTFTNGGYSENYHLGQDAHVGTAEVTNCVGYNSGDVGVEIDNATACLVSGCTMVDSYNNGYFYTNFTTPLTVGSDYCTFQNCRSILDRPNGGAFGYVTYCIDNIPLGDISVVNSTYEVGGTASGMNHAAFDTEISSSVLRSLTINGLAITDSLNLPKASTVHAVVASGTVSLQNITDNGTRWW